MTFLRLQRTAGKIHRRQKLSVGHLRQAFARSADADVAFDAVVVGLELFVADGPVFAVAVAAGGFEFVVAVTVALARPAESFSADLAAANPHERFVGGKCVRMFEIVDEELMTVVVAGVAEALDRLIFQEALLISEAAEFQLIGPDVFGEIASGDAGGPASSISTVTPRSVSSLATHPPLAPEPITRTSGIGWRGMRGAV